MQAFSTRHEHAPHDPSFRLVPRLPHPGLPGFEPLHTHTLHSRLLRADSRRLVLYLDRVEDRVGQVWASKWYEDIDLSNATIFVIVAKDHDWTNPHTGRVITSWVGRVLYNREGEAGRKYVWQEDNFLSGGDSYDNTYERIV